MKIIKRLIYVFLLVFSFSLALETPLAKEEYTSVYDSVSKIEQDNIDITNVYFDSLDYEEPSSFGLRGFVGNYNDYDVSILFRISYYDENYKEITSYLDVKNIYANDYDFADFLLSEDSLEDGYTLEDITYFNIEITSVMKTDLSGIDDEYVPEDEQDKKYEYVIDNYDIEMTVNENNTFDIKETITVYFNVPKHGIYRKIPLKNTVERLDGTSSKNRAQVTNLKVDGKYSAYKTEGYYEIKMGSSGTTVTGKQTYVIEYTYNIGKDPIKDADELYFNLIGTEWEDTIIKNVTFKIKMPKDFDESKLGFSSGKRGSTSNVQVYYFVDDNLITGSYYDVLNPQEALTVRCELEDGYFQNAGLEYNILDYSMFVVPVLGLIISFVFWYKFGRDDEAIETVEFRPPENCNSLDVGFLYKGRADSEDVTSLLIYLANKGYIKITETEEKGILSKSKEFKITKIKDYDGTDENEKLFLEGLFKNAKNKKDETKPLEVTSSDLYDSFYKTMNEIKKNENSKENKQKIFDKKATGKIKYVILLVIIAFLAITIPPQAAYNGFFPTLMAIISPFALVFVVAVFILCYGLSSTFDGANIFLKIFFFIWGGSFIVIPWVNIVYPAISNDLLYISAYVIGVICIVLMLVLLNYLPKRTPYGNEVLGKLRGFKNFLETAEKEKLEALVNEQPTYFYDILPYTYVLGVSDKWIKNFESISMQAPTWYDGPDTFDLIRFNSFLNSTMTSAQAAMSSSPSSSGSSGSSGGGFSGGGSGGGGGGSW